MRRGIHSVEDLRARCHVSAEPDACWIWEHSVVRRRPVASLPGRKNACGARIVAIVAGREHEREPHQRWSMRCGEPLCMNPSHIVLAKSHKAAHQLASKHGRLARGAECRLKISKAHEEAGRAWPRWMAEWAVESQQSHVEIAHALAVHKSTVGNWKRGTRRTLSSPFAGLLRLAA